MANSSLTRRSALAGLILVAACASSGSKDADGRTPEQQAFCHDYPNDYHCRPRYPTAPRQYPSQQEQTERTIDRAEQNAIGGAARTATNQAMRALKCWLGGC
jgi:hypothetical protein